MVSKGHPDYTPLKELPARAAVAGTGFQGRSGLLVPADKAKLDNILYGPNGEFLIGPGAGSKDYLWNSSNNVRLLSAPAGMVVSAQTALHLGSNAELNSAASGWLHLDTGQPGQLLILRSGGGGNTVEYWTGAAGADPLPVTNLWTLSGAQFAHSFKPQIWETTHNAAQSIANNTVTALSFNSPYVNAAGATGAAPLSGTPLTFTAAITGWYLFTTTVWWAASAGGSFRQTIHRFTGGFDLGHQDSPPMGGAAFLQTTVSFINLAATSTMQVLVVQNSGGALNVQSNAQTVPWFSGTLIKAM